MQQEQFKKEVLPLRKKLLRYALRILGDVEEAEDIIYYINRLRLGTFLDVKNISMCLFREAEQIKNKQVYFVLLSACTIFASKSKIGCALERSLMLKIITVSLPLSGSNKK